MTGLREAIEAACLEGLVETPHGYRYRPSVGADAVERALAAHPAPPATVVEECCCEVSPPEFGGPMPDLDCPIHGPRSSVLTARRIRGGCWNPECRLPLERQPDACLIGAVPPAMAEHRGCASKDVRLSEEERRSLDYAIPPGGPVIRERVHAAVERILAAHLAAAHEAGERDALVEVERLADKWRKDRAGYPTYIESGRISEIAVRLCETELRDAIRSAATR